jgi:hypothetical protein
VALLLAESGAAHVTARAQVLAGAGWKVKVVSDAARLAVAWQELYRAGEPSAGAPPGAYSDVVSGASTGTSAGEAAHD